MSERFRQKVVVLEKCCIYRYVVFVISVDVIILVVENIVSHI